MTKIRLGINAGFALNRYPEPEVWLRIAGEELGLRYIQFVADLLNPSFPHRVLSEGIKRIKDNARRYNVSIDTAFTDAYTRQNHLMHPDAGIREAWFSWFRDFIALSADLGARGCGSHFGILSFRDYSDPERRERMVEGAVHYWQELSKFGKERGLKFLIFEPMSVPREMAHTIDRAKELYLRVNEKAAIPILMCLDVDHGDSGSGDPRDIDPYAWLRELGHLSPVVHIKQSSKDKSGHWPFTEEYNERGIVRPDRVIEAIEASGADEVILLFEVSHRERYPADYRVIDDLKESVAYWRKYIEE